MSDLTVRYVTHKDEILLVFSQPVDTMTLSPQQARAMGEHLVKFADDTEQKSKVN